MPTTNPARQIIEDLENRVSFFTNQAYYEIAKNPNNKELISELSLLNSAFESYKNGVVITKEIGQTNLLIDKLKSLRLELISQLEVMFGKL